MNTNVLTEELTERQHYALHGSAKDYFDSVTKSLPERAERFFDWWGARLETGFVSYAKVLEAAPKAQTTWSHTNGSSISGVNFASQDYLSLASHPEVINAAVKAIHHFGVHSAGSSAFCGNVSDGKKLERELADFLQMEYVTLFPTGWSAGYGVIKSLVRDHDHIVIDALAHNCLIEGAKAATRSVHFHRHLDFEHAREKLAKIRANDTSNGILLITEGLFSMDSDSPDIASLQALAREYDATLLVDVAHDLGSSGPGGTGQIGTQNMLRKVDLVMGSFSKSFASVGGFVASHSRAMQEYLRYYAPPNTFSNGLSPTQIAVVRQCLAIIRSPEGEVRRANLFSAIHAARERFANHQIQVMGAPSAIVPILIGKEDRARLAAKLIVERGVFANLVEFPAVAPNTARFRMQMMADHTIEQAHFAADTIAQAISDATHQLG